MSAEELKAAGNAAFAAGRFEEAAEVFTRALVETPSNHVLYSNRSAARASLGRYEEALADAQRVVELKPDWPKGHGRLGAALLGLRRPADALAAYEAGLELDPANALLQAGAADARAAAAGPRPGAGAGGMAGLFSSPDVLARLAADPRTRALLQQPDFTSMLAEVGRDPGAMQSHLSDARFQLALEVGLGLRMAAPGADAAAFADETFGGGAGAGGAASEPAAAPKEPEPAPAPAEPEPVDEAAAAEAAARAAAGAEKDAGNAAYKAKDFPTAIAHYDRAIELFDKDISFLTNRAAAKLESGDLAGAVADCDAAVARGRELRADYKLVARALSRKGAALAKGGDLPAAIEAFNRALTEHRSADTLERLREAERAHKAAQEAAYVDLGLSDAEKDAGNADFKAQRYPEAVARYSEALKRGPPGVNPEAHKLLSNRAACYTKLGAWPEGLRDAEACVALAPAFAKGYSRKGHLQFFMKEYEKAIATYEAGLAVDPESAELREGLGRAVGAVNRLARGDASEADLAQRRERAMADPEVQAILTDPVMRQVLADMGEDPAAAARHMANPGVAAKVEKLVASGVVQMR